MSDGPEKILVTGAEGFIGSHVVRRLLENGYRAGVLVRSGSAGERLADLSGHSGLQIVEGDITSIVSLSAALDRFRPDGVIHLAASGVTGDAAPAEMIFTNTIGLANLLEFPEKLGRRLVAAGSVFEYGAHDEAIDEEAPCRPLSSYGLSKLHASELLFRSEGVDWVLLRPFGVYGPWEQPGRLLPSLLTGLCADHPVSLTDGKQVRDFVYVEDAADAFVKALESRDASGKVINIGSGQGVTVREFALAAARHAAGEGSERPGKELLRFGDHPRREADAPHLVARCDRAAALLGWKAANTLDEGIEKSAAWYASPSGAFWREAGAASRAHFSLVMPCYNEEASLPVSVPPLAGILERQRVPCELVLVNNGSSDGTGAAIDELITRGLPVKRVDIETNRGYGNGIMEGLKAAQGRFVGYLCADGQVEPEDVARILLAMERVGPGAIVKARRVTRNDGFFRWFQSRIFNLLCLILFRTMTMDVNGTPKVAAREVWEKLSLESRDWFIDIEVVVKAKSMNLNFVEVPVVFRPRQAGKSWVNLGTSIEFLRNLWMTVLKKW